MNKSHCAGCWNNHYNIDPKWPDGCWSLKDAKVVTKFEIGMDSPMNVKDNYRKVRRPDCFRTGGYSGTGTALVDKIPYYAE